MREHDYFISNVPFVEYDDVVPNAESLRIYEPVVAESNVRYNSMVYVRTVTD